MNRNFDLLLTAIAPAIWGSTYLVTTQLLPAGYPLTVAMLRALPAGLLLLAIVRRLPHGVWWLKSLVLGALNFSIFWWLLFISAYRLPGGVAATVGAVQPLIVIVLARLLLGSPIRSLSIVAAIAGIGGVALLILTPNATLDPVGIVAGIAGAFSMAAGTVLSRRWRPDVSPLTFTAWQLTAGGLLLLPSDRRQHSRLYLSRTDRRGAHLYPLVPRSVAARAFGRLSARLPQPDDGRDPRLGRTRPTTECDADVRHRHRAG